MDNQDLTQNNNNVAFDNFSHRMANTKLMALRAQNPFITILPFPNESVSLFLAANIPTDINLPSGTKMLMFSGNGEYFVSRKGKAEIPALNSQVSTGSIMNPEFCFFYVEEISQMSAIAPFDMRLTVHCFTQL